ncbi:MAG TPA: hypothetical protein PKD09_11330 [Aggregatilinea sp.]|uniref:CPBP family glutamic-type intramembrane protease n=1 Tax=Aggregatilinea sp. TaxID=2806333 RepID=UPI002C134C4C|nr:CPBP family glutamic-type intramembrane protease [Aggregatilinea sp.]HML22232.1 hypothetical protein [Aggregatilinea sp.]
MAKSGDVRSGERVVWAAAVVACGVFVLQTALADSQIFTLRWLFAVLIVGGAAFALRRSQRPAPDGPGAPEPVVLVLAALVGLAIWPVAWWLMDLSNHALLEAGPLPTAQSLIDLPDVFFGAHLHDASYELQILFAVVLAPLVQAWLVWGMVQPALGRAVGRWRAAWIAGAVGGALKSLIAVQNVVPGMPWGLASLSGYLLLGWGAALAVYLTGSAWAGFAAHAAFVYASFALRDDLARSMAGKAYLDVAWLTLLVLGLFVAAMLLQVIRFRVVRPDEPPRAGLHRLWIPLAVLLLALGFMAALDVRARRDQSGEERAALTPAMTVTTVAAVRPAAPSSPARPARG